MISLIASHKFLEVKTDFLFGDESEAILYGEEAEEKFSL